MAIKPMWNNDFVNPRSKLDLTYYEVLHSIKATLADPTERNFDEMQNGQVVGRYYWIRHDVDDNIFRAWEMAVSEHEHGIKAAYFFLNTARYFQFAGFLDMAKDFVKTGHTIGLHNNSITAALRGGDAKLADQILKRDLGYLRCAGDIWFTASHGDIWNRHHNTMNYEMFTECKRSGSFPHKPLAEYGLKYEAYFTRRDFYLSDSGGVWSTHRDINVSLSPGEIPKGDHPSSTIDAFNKSENGILQLLVHPEWWEPKP